MSQQASANDLPSTVNVLALPRETNARFYSILMVCFLFVATTPSSLDFFAAEWFTRQTWVSWRYKAWTIGGLNAVLVFALAALLYALYPSFLIRTRRLTPDSVDSPHAIQSVISDVAKEMSVKPPRLYWRPLPSVNGQMLGRSAPYILSLDVGMKVLIKRDPLLCRAIICHEFGHIVNGDIRKGYFIRLLLAVMTVLVLLPGVLLQFSLYAPSPIDSYLEYQQAGYGTLAFITAYLGATVPLLAPFAIMLVALLLLYAQFLRSREAFADWRASCHVGVAPLEHALRRTVETSIGSKSRLARLFDFHPEVAMRRKSLGNPLRLLWLKPADALGPGLIVGLVVGMIAALLKVEGIQEGGSGDTLGAITRIALAAQLKKDPAPADLEELIHMTYMIAGFSVAIFVAAIPTVFDFGAQVVSGAVGLRDHESGRISWLVRPVLHGLAFALGLFSGMAVSMYLTLQNPSVGSDYNATILTSIAAFIVTSVLAVIMAQTMFSWIVLSDRKRRRRPSILIGVINIGLLICLFFWVNVAITVDAITRFHGSTVVTAFMAYGGDTFKTILLIYALVPILVCVVLALATRVIGGWVERWRFGVASKPGAQLPLWLLIPAGSHDER